MLASGKARAKIVAMEGQDTPPSWRYTGSNTDSGQVPTDPSHQNDAPALPQGPSASIKWTASEYIAHDKNVTWYVIYGAATVVLALVIYLISRSISSTLVLMIFCAGIGAYAARKPRMQEYEVTNEGVRFAGKQFDFETFRSFALVHDNGAPSVWLIPLKRLMPPLIMYFEPKDEMTIVRILADYLPHEQRDYDLLERLMRYVRF